MYFLWIPAWCYQYCRFYKPACEHLCLLLAIPECTVVNAAIAAEELRDSKELVLHRTVHVCYALQNAAHTVDVPWSAGSGFMWACWWYPSVKDKVSGPAEMPKTLTELHQLPFPPSHPSDLANAWSLYSKSLFLSKCRKNFKFSTFLSVRNMISHLKYA